MPDTSLAVRRMKSDDIEGCVQVHELAFGGRELFSEHWINSCFAASRGPTPVIQFFIAERHGAIAGYIFWLERGGLRKEAILELDQIAVRPDSQGMGIGQALITESLRAVKSNIEKRGSVIGKLIISTRADNKRAQALYEGMLNAKEEAVIKDLFTTDEVIMVTRQLPEWL